MAAAIEGEGGVPREVELTLRLSPHAAEALFVDDVIRAFATAKPRLVTHQTRYFDTPDRRLRDARVSLRIRHIGARRIQTLKAAADPNLGLLSRAEDEHAVSGEKPDPSLITVPALRSLFASDRIIGRLAPVFETSIKRHVMMLNFAGAVVELALDRGEIRGAGLNAPICEIELELKSGPIDALYALAQAIHAKFPLNIEPLSKAERGYVLIDHRAPPPRGAERLSLPRDADLLEVFRRMGRNCLAQLRGNIAACRAQVTPEAVHQLRVAIRRLRSVLTAFRGVLPTEERRRLAGEIRMVMKGFDLARGLDVFLAETWRPLTRHVHDPAVAMLGEVARSRRASTARGITRLLDDPKLTTVLLSLEAWWEGRGAAHALGSHAGEGARDYARAILKRLRRKLDKQGRRIESLTEDGLHDLRIRAKRLRYTGELFRGLFPGRGAKGYLAGVAAIQDRLGLLNDAVVTRQLLGRLARGVPAARRAEFDRAAALVAGWAGARIAEDIQRLPAAWAAFADLKPFWR